MDKLPFSKKNYQLMIIGFLVIAVGFTFMALDPHPQGGFMGLTLSPIVVLSGFVLEVYAILYTPKKQEKTNGK